MVQFINSAADSTTVCTEGETLAELVAVTELTLTNHTDFKELDCR